MNRHARLACTAAIAALVLAGFLVRPAFAGGALETYDLSSAQPSPFAGYSLVDVIPIHWDARCIPVSYSLNDTLDPIPNPLGPPVLTLAAAGAAFQDSFDSWNAIRTSYIDMEITGTTSNPGTRGFDFVNELTFRTPAGFGAIASSPSVSLIADVTLNDGDDIDGDGDSDVSAAIATCTDVDSDGDIELPAGNYGAGTILDNDVQFAAASLRFTADAAAADDDPSSVDLVATATHEFGHSHGLAHVLNNQKSDTDGTGATMYPFIDTGDPASELAQRSLDSDDEAWSSYFYPEGSAASGPAALQPGDRAFDHRYRVYEGEITAGIDGEPVAGASVGAFALAHDKLVATAFSGHVRLLVRDADGALFFPPDPASGIIDGRYTLPLPFGVYKLGIEPVDGTPVSTSSINFTAQVGSYFGQLGFEEEFFDGPWEAAVERDPGLATPVLVSSFFTSPHEADLTTNLNTRLAPFGSFDFYGFTLGPAGLYYAVEFPRAELQQAFDDGLDLVQAGLYRTQLFDASVVPEFAEAALVRGVVNTDGTATLNLTHPLQRRHPFIAQDGDFSPYYFALPKLLSAAVELWLDHGPADEDLFLILKVPDEPWPGPGARAPASGSTAFPVAATTCRSTAVRSSPPTAVPPSRRRRVSTSCSRCSCRKRRSALPGTGSSRGAGPPAPRFPQLAQTSCNFLG